MKRRTNLKFYALAALASVAFATSNPATAADGKAYSGSFCKQFNAGDNVFAYGENDGSIQNFSTVDQSIICPVVKDVGGSFRAKVYVVDTNDRQNFDCRLVSTDPRFANILDQARDFSNGITSAIQTLDFDNRKLKSRGGAHAQIKCKVPGKNGSRLSRLIGYEIIED